MILHSHHLHVCLTGRLPSPYLLGWKLESLSQIEESFLASTVAGTSNSDLFLSVVCLPLFVELDRNKLFTSEVQSTSRKVLSSVM